MTVEEMEDTLARLEIAVTSIRGVEIQALCPAHFERTGKEDHNPSWYINADTGAHICFSCGWKGSLYSLISYVTGTAYEEADEWLGSTSGLVARFQRLGTEKPKIEEPTRITESMLSAFTELPHEACLARGILPAIAKRYGIKWDARNKNWIIPIREPLTNNLLGWQEKGFDHRYFNNRPTGVKKSETLFGYNEITEDVVIVVESPLDVVRLASLGYSGVATYGASVSKAQFSLIRGLGDVIFAMDNDEAGRVSSLGLLSSCNELGLEARFFNYSQTDMKDVGAMGRDEIEWGLQNARHFVRGEKAI